MMDWLIFFLPGIRVATRLYLNSGDMKFKDLSVSAGFGRTKPTNGSTGVTFVGYYHMTDGWDIYVCNCQDT